MKKETKKCKICGKKMIKNKGNIDLWFCLNTDRTKFWENIPTISINY